MTASLPRRRTLILVAATALLGGIRGAIAQSAGRLPRVVLLLTGSKRTEADTLEHYRTALRELGYVEDKNLILDVREIDGRFDRLPALIQDVMRSNPRIIVASGSQAIRAARAATSTVAIVAQTVGDPVEQGLANSLSAPGGNVTGNALIQEVSDVKTVEIVRDLLPRASRLVLLMNTTNPTTPLVLQRFNSTAAKLDFTASLLDASTLEELPKAFAKVPALRADAMVVGNDAFFRISRKTIIELAARYRLPAVYGSESFVTDGGLLSYSYDRKQLIRNTAVFVDRILKGKKPAELPFEQPTRFELSINLKTAKALGLTIPPSMLARAERIVE